MKTTTKGYLTLNGINYAKAIAGNNEAMVRTLLSSGKLPSVEQYLAAFDEFTAASDDLTALAEARALDMYVPSLAYKQAVARKCSSERILNSLELAQIDSTTGETKDLEKAIYIVSSLEEKIRYCFYKGQFAKTNSLIEKLKAVDPERAWRLSVRVERRLVSVLNWLKATNQEKSFSWLSRKLNQNKMNFVLAQIS